MNPAPKDWRLQWIAPSTRLRAPRAAAIAGIVFSVLLITSLLLLRRSVPVLSSEAGEWLRERSGTVSFAVNLVPFAGIAFLWFIGVLRDRLGDREDRFFTTVFLGSGLLFLTMLFGAAAFVGGIVTAYSIEFERLPGSATFTVARAVAYETMNVYAVRMAAVFTIATCTLALRTGFVSRWIAFIGYAAALALLFAGRHIDWIVLVFPLWVLLLSLHILVDNFGVSSMAGASDSDRKGDA
ncbi:UNVERIFIED_ORG: hypothetical protein BDU10_9940 [Burkholderia sp. CF145]|uniref:hypothetical protein n=1 Tax=Paraburkholderia hospita TaxID=169430 RepID=UPI0002716909|nr:hypothetical protein [Paraburkholderia hospita]EUC12447.1 hypothetical protein PMI06_008588 [Burkholderia sp. BT03]SKC49917.1 hypothetical protein SAMN06266956_0311 [Paraburkholderia hospita]SKD05649.1 hypothetical protein SAMN05445504_9555 [Burkholderia sp. CF099]